MQFLHICRATASSSVNPITAAPRQDPRSFFARPAELVAPELIGCLLVKRQEDGSLLLGVIVETEAYSLGRPRLTWLPPPHTEQRNALCRARAFLTSMRATALTTL